jgi:signal transduction histidine kinase
MKIRTRLSLWNLATTVVFLAVLGIGTYYSARHLALKALDREHELIAASIEGRFDTGAKIFADLGDIPYHVNRYLKESYVVVYDADERPVFQSPMSQKITLPITLVRDKKKAKQILTHPAQEMHTFGTTDDADVRFLAVSRKLYVNEREVGWLIIATPIGDIQHAARMLLYTLLAGVALLGLVAGAWTNYLTRKSLQPVAAIAATAERVSSSNLSERADVDNWDDEIGQLARVLNDMADRIQKAFESQQRFVADGAHELKTPLTILRTHWEDELNNPELSTEVKEKLVGDLETITRLTRVINNLLLLSQTEFAAAGFDMASVPLDELLSEVVSETEVLAGMKEQELKMAECSPVVVRGDKDRLHQLVFNLLDNAVKYTPEQGKIAVSLTAAGGEVVLRVEDYGIGISGEDLPHVFERFYRVSKDRSPQTGGSGLGLSICKMIAESHDGSIDVTSRPGEGSAFVVTLPAN